MNNGGSDTEREFFVTGARTYLDVEDAMTEFRRLVQHQCRSVVSDRLDEVNRTCGMDWTTNDLKNYLEKTPDCLYVGKRVAIERLGGLYFCLKLSRENDRVTFGALVYLYRQRASFAVDLWARLTATASDTSYSQGNNLLFAQRLSEDNIQDFRELLNEAINDFITFISDSGGLEQYLEPEA